MVLINDNFEQEVGRVLKNRNGNYLILEIKMKKVNKQCLLDTPSTV